MQLLDATEQTFREGGFRPPALADVAEATGASEERAKWALALLTERGAVVEAAPGLFFHAEAVAHARQLLESHIRRGGPPGEREVQVPARHDAEVRHRVDSSTAWA